MQFCHDHSHVLRNALRQRGLWAFVPSDSPLIEKEGKATPAEFDPWIMAGLLISEQAVRAFGTYLLSGNYCPLCEVEENLGGGSSFEWVDTDAETVFEICRELDLLPG